MDTSSYDIHSLNEISLLFIVLHCCYFSAMKRKQFISKFWVLHGGPQYKAPQTRILQIFWIGNYQKMDWKGEWLWKLETSIQGKYTYHGYRLQRVLQVLETNLGVMPENFLSIHESETHCEHPFTTVTEFFFSNDYFWNISQQKLREKYSHIQFWS